MNMELITVLSWVSLREAGEGGGANENLTVPDLRLLRPQDTGGRGSRTEAQMCS